MSKKSLSQQSLIHAVRIAANEARGKCHVERNPAYVKALDIVATALEQAAISSRADGNYYLVKLPDLVLVE